jgi:G6PDH family F420-dependent oxidoreductase
MTAFGYSLICEEHHPVDLVANARLAEAAGFDFVTISDHFHPWLESQAHSPYAWSVLGALAATTDRVGLVSLVTCPFLRYHPAIVAQRAATVAAMSGGRFELGLGAGENLNEHVVGRGWPPAHVRHEMLAESIEAITRLWDGRFHSFHGRHVTVHDARIYTLPPEPLPIHVAVSGPASIAVAAEHDAGMVAVEPDAGLVRAFDRAGGTGRVKLGQLAVCVGADEAAARRVAHDRWRFAAGGWKVQAELPNPVNFEAATAQVREEDVAAQVSCGPDPDVHAAAIQQWIDAGFTHVAVVQVGPDQQAFLRMWESELAPRLQASLGAAG